MPNVVFVENCHVINENGVLIVKCKMFAMYEMWEVFIVGNKIFMYTLIFSEKMLWIAGKHNLVNNNLHIVIAVYALTKLIIEYLLYTLYIIN